METKTYKYNPLQTYNQHARLFDVMYDQVSRIVTRGTPRVLCGRLLAVAGGIIWSMAQSVAEIAKNYGYDLFRANGDSRTENWANPDGDQTGNGRTPSVRDFHRLFRTLRRAGNMILTAQEHKFLWNGNNLAVLTAISEASHLLDAINEAIGIYAPEGVYVLQASYDQPAEFPTFVSLSGKGKQFSTEWQPDCVNAYLIRSHAEAICRRIAATGRFPDALPLPLEKANDDPIAWLNNKKGNAETTYDPKRHWERLMER